MRGAQAFWRFLKEGLWNGIRGAGGGRAGGAFFYLSIVCYVLVCLLLFPAMLLILVPLAFFSFLRSSFFFSAHVILYIPYTLCMAGALAVYCTVFILVQCRVDQDTLRPFFSEFGVRYPRGNSLLFASEAPGKNDDRNDQSVGMQSRGSVRSCLVDRTNPQPVERVLANRLHIKLGSKPWLCRVCTLGAVPKSQVCFCGKGGVTIRIRICPQYYPVWRRWRYDESGNS